MATEVHVGDIGTKFIATIKEAGVAVDVSGATVKQLKFQKPDGTVVTKTAAFNSDGTDGKIKYATLTGDLDQEGTWRVQGYVEMPGWSGHSDVYSFVVSAVLA